MLPFQYIYIYIYIYGKRKFVFLGKRAHLCPLVTNGYFCLVTGDLNRSI